MHPLSQNACVIIIQTTQVLVTQPVSRRSTGHLYIHTHNIYIFNTATKRMKSDKVLPIIQTLYITYTAQVDYMY